MLKIKDNVPIDLLQDYNFITTNLNHNGIAELCDGGIIKMWIDKNRLIHFNAPRYAQLDLIYQLHDLIEYTDEYWNNKMLSRPVLQEQNKELKKENERLHSIIKEVREYIKQNEKEYGSLEDNEKIILEILDKENKE